MIVQGDCDDVSAVRVRGTGVVFTVQDFAILILQCFTIGAFGPSVTAIFSRQIAIADLLWLRFSSLVGSSGDVGWVGNVLAASNSNSNINTGGALYMAGHATYFLVNV